MIKKARKVQKKRAIKTMRSLKRINWQDESNVLCERVRVGVEGKGKANEDSNNELDECEEKVIILDRSWDIVQRFQSLVPQLLLSTAEIHDPILQSPKQASLDPKIMRNRIFIFVMIE